MSHLKCQALHRRDPIIGTDLPPVQHESTFSVLLRLAARNVWNRRGICRVFELGDAAHNFSFYDGDSLLQQRIIEMTGWNWKPAERDVDGRLPHLNDALWSQVLRFCPICLSNGFHSLWFQFSAMQECPMHRCLLTDRCQSCGTLVGAYRFTAKLFATPFKCSECAGWIAGAPFIHGGGEDLRRHRSSIEFGFAPVSTWFAEAAGKLQFLNEIACRWTDSDSPFKLLHDRLLTGAMALYHPLPARLRWEFAAPVDIVAWRHKVANSVGGESDMPHRYGYLRYGLPLLVYRATLRALYSFVGTRPCEAESANLPMERPWGLTQVCRLSTLQAAYLLTRMVFERSALLTLGADLRGVVLDDGAFVHALVGNILGRLACRVVVLSAFSMLVALGGHFCRARLANIDNPSFQISSVIAFAGIALANAQYCVAILPKMGKFPVRPAEHVHLNRDVIEVINLALGEARSAYSA
ncbi:TniQ family protein [Paraburkholderia tagetis]|uniref:TniQ family protein n=1 Tax=Paraburkholderia tagetis TaxID=2913261 RepID=A0A9X1RM72_9BURK|nr:TniQ family protein [Paraburkholderia tagetis]MCG5072432.1 TniQ family protein [Paraburkholderia tagetis]